MGNTETVLKIDSVFSLRVIKLITSDYKCGNIEATVRCPHQSGLFFLHCITALLCIERALKQDVLLSWKKDKLLSVVISASDCCCFKTLQKLWTCPLQSETWWTLNQLCAKHHKSHFAASVWNVLLLNTQTRTASCCSLQKIDQNHNNQCCQNHQWEWETLMMRVKRGVWYRSVSLVSRCAASHCCVLQLQSRELAGKMWGIILTSENYCNSNHTKIGRY